MSAFTSRRAGARRRRISPMVLGRATPIVGAPMAGGLSTSGVGRGGVSNAGGFGFVAAGGYLSADRLADDISAARAATTGPNGATCCVPNRRRLGAAEYMRGRARRGRRVLPHRGVGQPVYATTTTGCANSR